MATKTLIDRWHLARGGHTLIAGSELVAGADPCSKIVHKYGAADVGTSFRPVTTLLGYPMPQRTAAKRLQIAAGNAADDTGNVGAHRIVVEGVDTGGDLLSETLSTRGAAVGTTTTRPYLRAFRSYVSESGTYADTGTASHAARIVVQDTGARPWIAIDTGGYFSSQSTTGCYTVPTGSTGFISSIFASVAATQSVDLKFLVRESILDVAAPYEAMREKLRFEGIQNTLSFQPQTPVGPFTGPCDFVFMARSSVGTNQIEIDFEILLYQ